MAVSATDVLGTGEIRIPPGVDAKTPEQRELYRAAAEFERFFVDYLMKQMDAATKSIASGDDDDAAIGSGSPQAYNDMVRDQMTQAVIGGGGLGIAAMVYQQISGNPNIPRSSAGGASA